MSAARRIFGSRSALVAVAAVGALAFVALPRVLAALRARPGATEAEFFESAGMARAGPPLENAAE